jgi:hypothetical protein
MADLTITGTEVAPVEVFEQWTGPAGATFSAGAMVRIDTATGKVVGADASTTDTARVMGMAIKGAGYVNETVTVVKRGVIDVGDALAALAYDAPVYLAPTNLKLASTASTISVIVGRVVPGWGATTADKLLRLDVRADL